MSNITAVIGNLRYSTESGKSTKLETVGNTTYYLTVNGRFFKVKNNTITPTTKEDVLKSLSSQTIEKFFPEEIQDA